MNQPPSNDPLTERRTAEELARIPYEPMLPAENWLVVGSLLLGLALLGMLLWLSAAYFPMAGRTP